jgi:hypothetical protein
MKNQDAKGDKSRSQPNVYRIFLASPGDVRDERELARAVIEQVRAERAFRGRFDLEIVAWDQPGAEVAMEAGFTPQEAIKRGLPKPSQCDLVIVILWSRMGTPLPAESTKPNGTVYLSGTEWEYLDAITAAKRFGKPMVWMYRRNQNSTLDQEDPGFDEKREQWQKVKAFFQTFVGEDGSLTGGVNAYQTPDEFRRQFERHLRDRLTVVLEELPGPEKTVAASQEPEVEDRILWTDAPYPGLEAFKPEQAPIFFGNPFLALAYALKAVLGTTGRREVDLAEELRMKPDGFAAYADQLLSGSSPTAKFLLIVDQFEEIFTLVADDDRAEFIGLIETVVGLPKIRVVATIRADFTANVAEIAALALIFQGRGIFLLSAPGVLALTEMIRRPARVAGYEIRDDLCEQILQDTGTGAGSLALMAFALH